MRRLYINGRLDSVFRADGETLDRRFAVNNGKKDSEKIIWKQRGRLLVRQARERDKLEKLAERKPQKDLVSRAFEASLLVVIIYTAIITIAERL
jgi:hypothetical protein